MPLYEYQCDACAHRFEVIQKFSDPLVDVCPKCGGVVRKLASSPAFQFKGSGWYITDYARKTGAPGGNASKDGGAAADKSSEAPATDSASSSSSKSSDTSSSSDAPAKTPKTA
jgi:putative FmdB family regulatory protein